MANQTIIISEKVNEFFQNLTENVAHGDVKVNLWAKGNASRAYVSNGGGKIGYYDYNTGEFHATSGNYRYSLNAVEALADALAPAEEVEEVEEVLLEAAPEPEPTADIVKQIIERGIITDESDDDNTPLPRTPRRKRSIPIFDTPQDYEEWVASADGIIAIVEDAYSASGGNGSFYAMEFYGGDYVAINTVDGTIEDVAGIFEGIDVEEILGAYKAAAVDESFDVVRGFESESELLEYVGA